MIEDTIFINYDPFAMESQVLVSRDGKISETVQCHSELEDLAEFAVRSAHSLGIPHITVRAPAPFYEELSKIAQLRENSIFGMNEITMENVR